MLTNTYMATHIASHTTFIAEPTSKGSRKLRWSVMPARSPGVDDPVEPRHVPLAMRRAAKAVLVVDPETDAKYEAIIGGFAGVGRVVYGGIVLLLVIMSLIRPGQSEPLPVPRPIGPGGSCPYGYTTSGSFCVPMQGAQDAIPKPPNGTCPWGWTSSGNFCLRSGSGR